MDLSKLLERMLSLMWSGGYDTTKRGRSAPDENASPTAREAEWSSLSLVSFKLQQLIIHLQGSIVLRWPPATPFCPAIPHRAREWPLNRAVIGSELLWLRLEPWRACIGTWQTRQTARSGLLLYGEIPFYCF